MGRQWLRTQDYRSLNPFVMPEYDHQLDAMSGSFFAYKSLRPGTVLIQDLRLLTKVLSRRTFKELKNVFFKMVMVLVSSRLNNTV